MTKVNKLKMIRKTTLIAMAVAGVFATMPTQAKNSASPNMAFSWDGTEVLVNNAIEGADKQTIKMNQDGSVTVAIDGVSVKKDGELVAVFLATITRVKTAMLRLKASHSRTRPLAITR